MGMKGTHDRGLEVSDDFGDGLPLGKCSGLDGGSDDALEDRKAREERDSESRKSHLGVYDEVGLSVSSGAG
jgi:hypothetical protein